VTIVVGFPAGGNTDVNARIFADKLQARWGQPVIVENRPGAASGVANAYVRQKAPDGYTLYVVSSPYTVSPYVNPKTNEYNPLKDFTPIALLSEITSIAVAPATAPFNTMKEMVDYVKRHPGKVNVGTSGLGSSDHLSQARMAKMGGLDYTVVHFAGDAPAWQALAGGVVDFRIGPYASSKSLIDAGKLKVLGTATMERSPSLPGYAPISEVIPGFAHVPYNALIGPAGMNPELVRKINADANAVGKIPEVVSRLSNLGLIVINDKSSAQLSEYLQAAINASRAAVEASGIKPE
jgi:tripartite-type tricarboxylate transporter receptor subunit TctC